MQMVDGLLRRGWAGVAAVACLALLFPSGGVAATRSPKQTVVPTWSRFERVLISNSDYSNALQEVSLTAVFTSPVGERRIVNGFWDGGRIWRVRFHPDMLGQWTFTTFCSDPRNQGLDGQTGKFLCTSPVGDSDFQRHGPIHPARDHTHFEHADGTPFFWLADTAGSGAMLAGVKDWERYATIRSSQRFNVALWSVGRGDDYEQQSPLTGFPERIGVNPRFFQHLDARIEMLAREGILSAIEPLAVADSAAAAKPLPEDQGALLLNYLRARWDTEPVAWVINLDNSSSEAPDGRWEKICRAVFTNSLHAPVIVCSKRAAELAHEYQDQPWVDALGIAAPANSTAQAPTPADLERPVLLFAPCENALNGSSGARYRSDDVRRAVYESLFLRPPAGVIYAAQGVIEWDDSPDSSAADRRGGLPLWERALFMPGAKQMRALAQLMDSIDFWRLRPRPDAVPDQPAHQFPVSAASTSAKDLTLVYVPQPGPVDVSLQAMPPSPLISWLEPRQGSTRSAVAVVSGSVCQFPSPGDGDWVLLIKSGK